MAGAGSLFIGQSLSVACRGQGVWRRGRGSRKVRNADISRGGGRQKCRGCSGLRLREKRVNEVAAAGAAVFHLRRGRLRGA